MGKLAVLGIPDEVYNWVVSFLEHRCHCTKYGGKTSGFASITAGIIQGSIFGPTLYNVALSKMQTTPTL